MRNLIVRGNSLEQDIVDDALQRLSNSGLFVTEFRDLEMLGIELTVEFREGQIEDGLLIWHNDGVRLGLARRYTHIDKEHLPYLLAHEVFGHALWEAKAMRENVQTAVHFHLCNEINAHILGWLASIGLGIKPRYRELLLDFHINPDEFKRELPYTSPHYVLLLSTKEMQNARQVLQERLNALATEWVNLRSESPPVCNVNARENRLAEMIRLVTRTITNFEAEPNNESERWLAEQSRCAVIQDLEDTSRIHEHTLRALLERGFE